MQFAKLGMVIAAGGAGKRFGTRNKLLAQYRGEAVLLHSLRTFLPVLEQGYCVVAAPAALMNEMRTLADAAFPDNGIVWCEGGATRIASTIHGVNALPRDAELIAVHDAARPLASVALLEKLVKAAKLTGGAIPGATPVDTVKVLDESGMVTANPIRKQLAAVGTPQVFQAQPYRAALAALPEAVQTGQTEDAELTDDAAIFMKNGGRVQVVLDSAPNPKITVAGDIER